MMRRAALFFLLFISLARDSFADFAERITLEELTMTCFCGKVPSTVDLKVGYFFFSDSKMRDVYDQGGLDVQLSAAGTVWRWLQLYGSVEYLQRHGKSLNGNQNTNIWIVPLSLGLRPILTINEQAQFYLTLGPRYFFLHAHNDSTYVKSNLDQNGLGGFCNIGFNFFPNPHLLVDIFGEYSYKRMEFNSSVPNSYGRNIQIGGFTFGAGIGRAF